MMFDAKGLLAGIRCGKILVKQMDGYFTSLDAQAPGWIDGDNKTSAGCHLELISLSMS